MPQYTIISIFIPPFSPMIRHYELLVFQNPISITTLQQMWSLSEPWHPLIAERIVSAVGTLVSRPDSSLNFLQANPTVPCGCIYLPLINTEGEPVSPRARALASSILWKFTSASTSSTVNARVMFSRKASSEPHPEVR